EGYDAHSVQGYGRFVGGLCAFDEDFAKGRAQHAGIFEECDEPDGFTSQGGVFLVGVCPQAGGGGCVLDGSKAFSALSQAMQQAKGLMDVFLLEADGGQFVCQNIGLWTGLG